MQWEGKPWHGLSGELKARFGQKTVKLSLDGGFTCPNRDGTVGDGGCAFCAGDGSGAFAGDGSKPVTQQIAAQQALLSAKWGAAAYIAYFQNFSGTYQSPEALYALYEQAITAPGVVGLAVGTRPDCLGEGVLAVLAAFKEKTFLWIELGLQTVHDETARAFGRGYDFDRFLKAYEDLSALGIPVVVHLINGLPHETPDMMLRSAETIAALRPWGIKLHLLHVLEGTRLADSWRQGEYEPMDLDTYIRLVADQLERFSPETVVHRLTGDGARDMLLAPMWSLDKKRVLGGIEQALRQRGSYQGIRFQKERHR